MESNVFSRRIGRLSIPLILLSFIFLPGINSCQQREELYSEDSALLKNAIIPQENIVKYWGHETFNRNSGEPVTIKKKVGNISLVHFAPEFVINLQNGDGTKNLVSSATVKIDGKLIFRPSDFSQKVVLLSKEITELSENSEIEVELKGSPGSYIDIWINGTLKPGNVVIDSEGGELVSDNGLLNMSIPPNAVSEKTFFSAALTDITLPGDIPGDIKGFVYLLEPGGIDFESPMTVVLKYNPELFSNVSNIRIFHWSPELGTYDIIVPSVNTNSHELTFTINHFSVIGTFELENSFLKINNTSYALSVGLLGYYGNFEGRGVYNHSIYLLSPDHNINLQTFETTGTGAVVNLEIFNTKDHIENGTYMFSLPEVMNTIKRCDGTDVNADGIVDDKDCFYTMPDGGSYVCSRLSSYSSNADMHEYLGLEFKSGSVSITKDGEVYTIIMDCVGKNDDVIKGYYKGRIHYYDFSQELPN